MRSPTIGTPSLLKLVLILVLQMEIQDDLTTGIHPFVLFRHMATVRKFLCGHADQYSMVASGAGDPSLADVEFLLAPDRVTLLKNLSIGHGQWIRTQLIVRTSFGVDHNTSKGLKDFGEEMLARETDLEEYILCNLALRPQVPALILYHAQI